MRSRTLVVAACFLLAGCVGSPDPSDTASPTLDWYVAEWDKEPSPSNPSATHRGWLEQTLAATSEGQVNAGVPLRITVRAKDAGGLNSLLIRGAATWSCPGSTVPKVRAFNERKEVYTPVNGNARIESALMIETDTVLDCGGGSKGTNAKFTMNGEAVDSKGLTTAGTLTLKVLAP